MFERKVRIIGGGLAGCEAAYYLAERGISVHLHEMRPVRQTEAHTGDALAELVCSNSFKSLNEETAPGILKKEMEILGSLSLQAAKQAAIPAGESLSVDREKFASFITGKISSHPKIALHREEILSVPDNSQELCIVATGPLTSPALSESLRKLTGEESFYFYDAISPIMDAGSIDFSVAFYGNRYGKKSRSLEDTGEASGDTDDYINCPMNKEQYYAFIDELLKGERVEPKSFERVKHFEGCMPIEEMADRGRETLRFGPMKPVGLVDPKTGREAYAVVQLRPENASKSAYNLVGFQTKLKYGEQTRIFRKIPGLEQAEFLRLGSMHRNSFLDSPRLLLPDLSLKQARHIMFAGQITGVEGYMESASTGILAGIFAHARLEQRPIPSPPEASAMGALLHHLRNSLKPDFQPSGINFSLFEDAPFHEALAALRERFPKKLPKQEKRAALSKASLENIRHYAQRISPKA